MSHVNVVCLKTGASAKQNKGLYGRVYNGHGARDAAQGLAGVDHGSEVPGVALLLACLFETLEACRVFGHGADICLQDDVLRRCGAYHRREPPERGWVPGGPARGADGVPEQKGCETACGIFAITEGIFAGPRKVAHGCICHRGTETAVRSPERARRASGTASRRSVVTRLPACLGISAGATTQPSSPLASDPALSPTTLPKSSRLTIPSYSFAITTSAMHSLSFGSRLMEQWPARSSGVRSEGLNREPWTILKE